MGAQRRAASNKLLCCRSIGRSLSVFVVLAPAMIKLVDHLRFVEWHLVGQGNPLRAGRIAPELDNTTNRPFSFLISSI